MNRQDYIIISKGIRGVRVQAQLLDEVHRIDIENHLDILARDVAKMFARDFPDSTVDFIYSTKVIRYDVDSTK